MKTGLIVLCVLGVLLSAEIASGQADLPDAKESGKSKPVKVAIIGDTEKVLSEMDLLTAKLSENPNIHLLERSDWDYLLREHTIAISKIGQNSLEIGRLLGADALIILTEKIVGRKKILFTKLVAVKNGVVLDSIASPVKNNKETFDLSSVIKFRFEPKIAKLASSTKKTVVSMLNIRAAFSSPDLLALEHDLNAALAHRLMMEENLLVSERWNIAEAELENNLAGSTGSDYATGAVILDGKISSSDKDTIEVELTFKKSDGKLSIVTVKGKKGELGGIVDKLADKCLEETDTLKNTRVWDRKQEAAEYLKEAIWAEVAGLYSRAAQAAESAWALGDRSEDLVFLRIRSYAKAANPQYFIRYRGYARKIGESGKCLDAAIMALDLYKHCIIKSREKADKKFMRSSQTSYNLGTSVLDQSVELLAAYYEKKKIDAFPEKQAAVRKLIRECLEFFLKGEEQFDCSCAYFSKFTMQNCKYFIESDDELIAMYKRLLGHHCLRWRPLKDDLRKSWDFFYYQSTPPFRIDRSGRYNKSVTLAFIDKMTAEFAKSDNLQLQLDALMIKYFYGREIKQRDNYFRFEVNPEYLPLIHKFYDEHKEAFWSHEVAPVPTGGHRYRPVLKFPHYYYVENLQHRDFRIIYRHSREFDAIVSDLSYEQKKEFYGILRKRVPKNQIELCSAYSEFLKAIMPKPKKVEMVPDKKIALPDLDSSFILYPGFYTMKDNKIYIPYIKSSIDQQGFTNLKEATLSFSLAIVDTTSQTVEIVHYQPLDTKTLSIYNSPWRPPVVHNGKMYIVNNIGVIYALDLKGGKIEVIDLKIRGYKGYINIMNNKLYVTLVGSHTSGDYKDDAMIEYDLNTKKQKFIFYSRRKPATNPLDSRLYKLENVVQLSEKYILIKTYEKTKLMFYVVDVDTGAVKNIRSMPDGFMKDYVKYVCLSAGYSVVVFKRSLGPFVSMIKEYKFKSWKKFFAKWAPSYRTKMDGLANVSAWHAYYMLIHNDKIPSLLMDRRMRYSPIGTGGGNGVGLYSLNQKKRLEAIPVYTPYEDSHAIVNTEYGAFQLGKTGDMPVLFYSRATLKKIHDNPDMGVDRDVREALRALDALKKVKYDGSPEAFKKIRDIVAPEAKKGYKLPQIILIQTMFGLNDCRGIRRVNIICYKKPPQMETETLNKWLNFIKSEAKSGNLFYKNVLGILYVYERVLVKHNVEKAHALWKEAADAGSMLALLKMGTVLSNSPNPTEEDKRKMVDYYTKAAEKGSAFAAFALGVIYNGTPWGNTRMPPDYAKSIKYYQQAIEQGRHPVAYRNLGLMYFYGTGVEVDKEKAKTLFEKGYKQGDSDCQYCLWTLFKKKQKQKHPSSP